MPIDPLVLRQTTAFQLLDDDELAELTAHVDERSFAAGQVIFQAGEPGGAMHVVLSGKVEVFLVDEDRKRVVLNELGPGEIFGELSLFDGDPRSASVRALEATRTFLIDRADLERLFAHRPHAALEVLTVMSRRLRRTDLLLSQRVARNPNDVLEEKADLRRARRRRRRALRRLVGLHVRVRATCLLVWVGLNTVLLLGRPEPFDPYPFILLNLFLSMLAAIQAPVIMMSQNRQDTKDRVRSELDYQVNLKAELEIMELHEKFDRLEQRIEATQRTPAR